ncbi:ATP-grasp fold amidoligase family protein [Oceanobacillus kimchii]|uniref:ATP-grasp fold amidoligase family protein n=1 Tax=Oceanobacillus kimchii TaxID=746691 RepID=UPI003B0131DD
MLDYKKIIPSQNIRLKILKLIDFIPDKPIIKLQYRIKTGRKLNLNNPKRFTEKLQWYKLNYRHPLMTQCADKFGVREYIISKGYEEILIPIYGVYNKADDINFNELPNKFVLKTSNGSRTNIICEDKSKLNIENTKKLIKDWLINRTTKAGREWPYYNIKPVIICEELLKKDKNNDLVDYKFICFNGKVEYVFINAERYSDNVLRFGIYNKDFEQLPYTRKGLRNTDNIINKPRKYERMITIAERLSENFPHVRVDLYNVDGNIYFGELTFFHGSGYVEFEPDEFDFILGKSFNL